MFLFLLFVILYSSLAQSVEHLTVNQGVVGSSPTGGAKKLSFFGTRVFLSKLTGLVYHHDAVVYIINNGLPLLYLITPLGVY